MSSKGHVYCGVYLKGMRTVVYAQGYAHYGVLQGHKLSTYTKTVYVSLMLALPPCKLRGRHECLQGILKTGVTRWQAP